jgi:hypothetical protein
MKLGLPFFSFPSLQSKASEPSLTEGVGILSLRLLPGVRGCLGKADKEKKQVILRAGLLILLEEVCNPRNRAKRSIRENTISQTKVISCPYFISSFQKQCFPGLEKCHIFLFPQSYCCHRSSLYISYWLSSKGR